MTKWPLTALCELTLNGSINRTARTAAIYALFDKAEELMEGAPRDAAPIAEARRIKHYEIAACEALRRFARVLDRIGDEQLLNETIREKGGAGIRLWNITARVNPAGKAAWRSLIVQ